MTRQLQILREAREEAEAAASWYADKEPALGQMFVREVERGIAKIFEAPNRWPVCPDEPRARRLVLDQFPFALVYSHSTNVVTVLAVAHTRRSSGYWRDRVQ